MRKYMTLAQRTNAFRCKKTHKRRKTRCRLRLNHGGDCNPKTEG